MTARLPLWFKYVTMLLCLAYCSVMALVTIVYGIKVCVCVCVCVRVCVCVCVCVQA
jgi:hypothetical protein